MILTSREIARLRVVEVLAMDNANADLMEHEELSDDACKKIMRILLLRAKWQTEMIAGGWPKYLRNY